LINYSSGLLSDNVQATDQPPLHGSYSLQQMRDYLNSVPATGLAPACSAIQYTYSNLAFAMLGALSASIFEDDFETALTSQIFRPLGFSDSAGFLSSDASANANIPKGYNFKDYAQRGIAVPASWDKFPAYHAAGGVALCGNDMLKWLIANMGGAATPVPDRLSGALIGAQKVWPPIVDPTRDNAIVRAGSGWFAGKLVQDLSFRFKDGLLRGATAYMAFEAREGYATSKAGVFVLCNGHGMRRTVGGETLVQAAN
jgi:CubicO group peptidase (beta-lactamase class C family)